MPSLQNPKPFLHRNFCDCHEIYDSKDSGIYKGMLPILENSILENDGKYSSGFKITVEEYRLSGPYREQQSLSPQPGKNVKHNVNSKRL